MKKIFIEQSLFEDFNFYFFLNKLWLHLQQVDATKSLKAVSHHLVMEWISVLKAISLSIITK